MEIQFNLMDVINVNSSVNLNAQNVLKEFVMNVPLQVGI